MCLSSSRLNQSFINLIHGIKPNQKRELEALFSLYMVVHIGYMPYTEIKSNSWDHLNALDIKNATPRAPNCLSHPAIYPLILRAHNSILSHLIVIHQTLQFKLLSIPDPPIRVPDMAIQASVG